MSKTGISHRWAERSIFVPDPDAPGFVRETRLTIKWAGGHADVQKKRHILAVHETAAALGIGPVLEVSTNSEATLGQRLSAFNLKVNTKTGDFPLECVYQGSKAFERGGPYTDLFATDPRSAKRDPRLRQSGPLVAFVLDGDQFPLEPKTAFYDWLYICAIFPHRDVMEPLDSFPAFSDIEFNPLKSINCQARSLALFVALKTMRLLGNAVRSRENFIDAMLDAQRQQ